MGREHLPALAEMLPEKTAGGCLFRKQKRPDFNVLPGQGAPRRDFGQRGHLPRAA